MIKIVFFKNDSNEDDWCRSPVVPRVGEHVVRRGKSYRVTEVIYNFNPPDEQFVSLLLVHRN